MVLAAVGLGLLASGCDSRQLATTTPDAGANQCANVGCAAPPLCSAGCQATCGCCACAPGERNGDLVCTSQGCYAPAPAVDGGDACGLAFDPGPCDAAFPVYAFVGGACVPRIFGGCQGNGNRFTTVEECLATCAGAPTPGACPPNRTAREICLACGPAGGCAKTATVCALVCSADGGTDPVCPTELPYCQQGVCQQGFCI